jgi:hypothetical protein
VNGFSTHLHSPKLDTKTSAAGIVALRRDFDLFNLTDRRSCDTFPT